MIYTFGDGFASGHIWPEWPQLIEAITNTPVTNFGHIGAGNEYIFNCAVKSALTASSQDLFLVQWAIPTRFDKLLGNGAWADLQATDPVYKNINATAFGQRWWSTSGSRLKEIQHYGSFYIEEEQAVNRSVLYMISLSKLLDSMSIPHRYFSTYSFDYSSHANYKQLEALPWADLAQGMDEWIKVNTNLRGTEVQPSTTSQLQWIVHKLLTHIPYSPDRLRRLTDLVSQTEFVPYDPDRAAIWQKIKDSI